MTLQVSIIGASGYTGGELMRLLIPHPQVVIKQVTSERFAGKPVTRCHPHLRQQTSLKFVNSADLESCDLIFSCLPHGKLMHEFKNYQKLAPRLIDLSADFRLRNPQDYDVWYEESHACPNELNNFCYGIAEIHRQKMQTSHYIAGTGCNAITTILGLYPLIKNNLVDLTQPIVAEAKVGSSEAGNKAAEASHHPNRARAMRSFKPVRHRHTAEIIQELTFQNQIPAIHFSATAVELVRGILVTAHVFLKQDLSEKDIWKIYRQEYQSEPFIRIVKEKNGINRYPDPKLLTGTNFCDIGFEKDPHSKRLVVLSALDNLMKGAAGQAVQSMNIMYKFPETTGLEFFGLNPI